ncbi:MAG TPA: glycosyltransferase family 2 protein [Blastocatellia bacterium]|nr:glycosyltransferase family 2 protein [Blastocatellia bacterium]
MKISVTVITFNEEDRIADALESVSWADEIVVVDAGSTDRTREIARRYTDRVLIHPWSGYAAQKQYADSQASHEWIFSLDADERVSPALRRSIEAVKREGPQHDGYRVARRAWYLGRWIAHGGWYPDYQLRLYRRDRARWVGDFVHESVRVEGRVGRLDGDLWHLTRRSLSEHHEVLGRYTTLAAEQDAQRGVRVGLARLLFQPALTFIRSYLLRQGFRDGVPGLIIAGFAAYYVFLKYAKLWEKQNLPQGWGTPPPPE